jgi:hypothetical protein
LEGALFQKVCQSCGLRAHFVSLVCPIVLFGRFCERVRASRKMQSIDAAVQKRKFEIRPRIRAFCYLTDPALSVLIGLASMPLASRCSLTIWYVLSLWCAQREVSDRASVNGSQIESSHLRTVCADGITTGICERFTDAREQGRVLLAASRAVYLELDSR